MRCPPFGLCLPVEFHAARDVDTIEVRVSGSSFVWAIRLVDTWGPELHRGDAASQRVAAEGKAWVEKYLASIFGLRLWVQLPHTENLLKCLSFDRVPGFLFVGGGEETVNRMIVRRGYASSTKGGELGE